MNPIALLPLLVAASPALANVDPLEHGSMASGFTHPLLGTDHLLAMVAIGLWAVVLGGRARLALPVVFVGAMVAGFGLSLSGVMLPLVEPMILGSVMVLGVMVAAMARLSLPVAVPLVAVMGLAHGFAHGAEMGPASAVPFFVGFGMATGILHAAGIVAGQAMARFAGVSATRGAGAAVAVLGTALTLAG